MQYIINPSKPIISKTLIINFYVFYDIIGS